jgi:hypothetical protein
MNLSEPDAFDIAFQECEIFNKQFHIGQTLVFRIFHDTRYPEPAIICSEAYVDNDVATIYVKVGGISRKIPCSMLTDENIKDNKDSRDYCHNSCIHNKSCQVILNQNKEK